MNIYWINILSTQVSDFRNEWMVLESKTQSVKFNIKRNSKKKKKNHINGCNTFVKSLHQFIMKNSSEVKGYYLSFIKASFKSLIDQIVFKVQI